MKLTVMILILIASSSYAGWIGPSNYDECIFENMKGVNSNAAALIVKESCINKFRNTSPKSNFVYKIVDGYTIEELYKKKHDLSGETLSIRGKVVMASSKIMDIYWVHLQDGSGNPALNNFDLVVASNTEAKVGDTVVAKGVLSTDKDYGYGFRYDLILEKANLTFE